MATVAIVPLIELILPVEISIFSDIWLGPSLVNLTTSPPAPIAWGVNNRIMIYGFTLQAPYTIRRLKWVSGTVALGNYDLGIYDKNFSLLRSIGSTANPGGDNAVTESITALSLQPGNYWFAMSFDTAAATVRGVAAVTLVNVAHLPFRAAGTAFPLPNSITPGGAIGNIFPVVGLSTLTN